MSEEFKPKLQILVPQYKETEEIIKPLLDSIAIQQRIDLKNDISVIIVNDGSDVILSQDFLRKYPYRIDYILNEHLGVSAARNEALDYATADYVMFCDADDMFYITHAIWIILDDLKKEPADIINSVFYEEVFYIDQNFAKLIKHEQDRTFVHGKIYRRQYLVDNDIRWNEKLHIHEDLFFNTLAMVLTKDIRFQDIPFYLWRYRKDSVCRDDPEYLIKTYPNLIESNYELLKEFLKRDQTDAAIQIANFVTLDTYYSMQLPLWHTKENVEYRAAAEKEFAKLFNEYGYLFHKASLDLRRKTASGIRERTVKSGMVMELVSFADWIDYIVKLGNEQENENGE